MLQAAIRVHWIQAVSRALPSLQARLAGKTREIYRLVNSRNLHLIVREICATFPVRKGGNLLTWRFSVPDRFYGFGIGITGGGL